MKELKDLFKRRLSHNNFKDTNTEGVLLSEQVESLQRSIEAKDSIISALKDHIFKVENEYAALISSHSSLKVDLKQAKNEISTLRGGSESPVNAERGSLLQENKNLLMMNDSMESQLQLMRKVIESKDEEIQKLAEEIESLKVAPTGITESDRIKDLERKLRLAAKTTNELMHKNAIVSKANEDLKFRLEKHQIKNDKMCKQLMTTRGKPRDIPGDLQSVKRQLSELSETGSPANNHNLCPDLLFSIKIQMEKVYKMLLVELSKINDGDISCYMMSTPDLCAVEHEMNKIIMNIQEKIESTMERGGSTPTFRKHYFFGEGTPKSFRAKAAMYKRKDT